EVDEALRAGGLQASLRSAESMYFRQRVSGHLHDGRLRLHDRHGARSGSWVLRSVRRQHDGVRPRACRSHIGGPACGSAITTAALNAAASGRIFGCRIASAIVRGATLGTCPPTRAKTLRRATMTNVATLKKSARIRVLNDNFRSTFLGGQV